jgi:hypothetical protein
LQAAQKELRGEGAMTEWSVGIMEYWVLALKPSLHHSTTPSLHYSSLDDTIERNEVKESFSKSG